MKKFIKSKLMLQVAIATLVTTLATAGIVFATTVGTDVSTAALTVSSTLAVTGATTLSDTLTVTGAATLSSTLAVTGAATLSSVFIASSTATTLPEFNASGTAVSIGNGTPLKKLMFGSCTVDLPATLASSTSVANCTAAGVVPGDIITITPVSTSSSMVFRSASSTAADTIQVSSYNTGYATGIGVPTTNPDATTWYWMAMR
ncbi:MAG: hypothetical protein WCV41_01810 [Patescibacteria group bacterium]